MFWKIYHLWNTLNVAEGLRGASFVENSSPTSGIKRLRMSHEVVCFILVKNLSIRQVVARFVRIFLQNQYKMQISMNMLGYALSS